MSGFDVLMEFQNEPKLWDKDSGLPIVPIHNNPWLYCAYAMKILEINGLPDAHLLPLRRKVRERLAACKVTSGVYHRWPGGRGGLMSHDEVLGLAYLDPEIAREIYFHVVMTDGLYANEPVLVDETANIFRIFWVRYVLMGLAGVRMSLFSQALFGAFLVIDALLYKGEGDGSRLRFWLAEEALERVKTAWLLGLCFVFWQKRMEAKGLSPKKIFSEKYLNDIPVLGKYAPSFF